MASQENEIDPDSPSTTWIARFQENHNSLPRVLFPFGCKTVTKAPPQRFTVSQCTRCWLWHNSRSCASVIRCRLCGSTKHTETSQKNLYAASTDYVCLPRCIHCHGPHPSDDPSCVLRLTQNEAPKSRSQISTIRKICVDSCMRQQARVGCVKASHTSDTNNDKSTQNTVTLQITATTDVTHNDCKSTQPKTLATHNSPFDVRNAEEEQIEVQMKLS